MHALLTALPMWSLLKEQEGKQPEKADYHHPPGSLLSTLQYLLKNSQNLRKEGLSVL